MVKPTTTKLLTAQTKAKKFREQEWYGIRSLLGYNWAWFFCLLGARESGKSYAVTEFFVRQWKKHQIPFTWLRLNEASTKRMLAADAEKLVDADIYRKYGLKLTVKGNNVYDHGKRMATVLALSTFANDKGTALFDKDFLKMCSEDGHPMYYHICLDEFQLEKTQKRQGDICYQFVNQMENLVRSTKERMRIFLIGNTLEECSEIMTMFNFIPEEFGRYKLKKKRCVVDYMPLSQHYIKRRTGTVSDILASKASNFTNKIDFDRALISKKRLMKPQYIIAFDKSTKFTVWNDNIVARWNKENCASKIAMRPYIDLYFSAEIRDGIIQAFDSRGFLYHDLITNKMFQKEIQLIKPRKQ